MRGFCFSEIGKELSIQYPDPNTDFFIFLSDYAKKENATHIAMKHDDYKFCRLGVKDLLRAGLNVIIVDPSYSPIDDEEVLPVFVHRNINTLDKHFPDCVVIGELVSYFHHGRKLKQIKSYFQEGVGQYKMNALSSGWRVLSTAGGTDYIKMRVYEYVVERDYELEKGNAKRNRH
ncbi:hypothetical protein [Enterobacter phage EspM4VN]|uniref:Uncharacterized protein n=1 Tax=Enterobacter phage EspM4VN TaxID=2137745 RepID=A0A4P2WVW1_9CAUD|nr:hypothetical protein HYP11_gp110 [Enterobacter phage EspM4VN]BBK03829.1 hypothetical protein [Enterobacter phage EspM4VN]